MAIKRIDLSQQYTNDMPRFPGMEAPHIELLAQVEMHGFGMERFQMTTHLGTHTDFGAHISLGGKKRQNYTPSDLWVDDAQVLHFPGHKGAITLAEITPYLSRARPGGVVLIATGHSSAWGIPAYYRDNPYLERRAAQALIDRRILAIGFDGPSADPVGESEPTGADDFPLHQLWLGAGCLILENLTRLQELPEQVELVIGAINIRDATGIPSAIWAKFSA
ncbi:MAG TPA: cyclase family protein [Ktedonobacterales bacterium]|nr:cyclase family protein [Ktedonobacterales bacterium]